MPPSGAGMDGHPEGGDPVASSRVAQDHRRARTAGWASGFPRHADENGLTRGEPGGVASADVFLVDSIDQSVHRHHEDSLRLQSEMVITVSGIAPGEQRATAHGSSPAAGR